MLNQCRECMQLLHDDRLADFCRPRGRARRSGCRRLWPMASCFGFADLVIMIAGQAKALGPSGLHVETTLRSFTLNPLGHLLTQNNIGLRYRIILNLSRDYVTWKSGKGK